MDIFTSYKMSSRRLEDVMYPKDSYFSSKPLPVLNKQMEDMGIKEKKVDDQVNV